MSRPIQLPQALASQLSTLVVEALVQIGLTEHDVLGGAIDHTMLTWQIPPLVVEAPIFGTSFSEYTDRPTYVSVPDLLTLYSDALTDMRNNPGRVLNAEGYKLTSKAVPNVRAGERQLYFSLPDNFPHAINDYAGVMLSLECAHLMRFNAKIEKFVSDDDNYYVQTSEGYEIGVKDGLPTLQAQQWDLPVHGMVQELLRTPRGAAWEGCDYNIIAKVRSVAETYKKSIRDHEAVDWALQTLRVIEGDRELLQAVRRLKAIAYDRDHRLRTLHEAVEISQAAALSDRQRIEALKALLVPDILTSNQFSKQLYGFYQLPPPILAEKVLTRIRERVLELHGEEEALYARAQRKPGGNL